jgi:CheY-like chemotaxis protein
VTLPLAGEADGQAIAQEPAPPSLPKRSLETVSTIDVEDSRGEDANDRVDPEDQPMVLVVEDNADVRTYILENVTEHYDAVAAGTGVEGLEIALDRTPDLIITDVMMPGMDGFELARRLRSDERTSHIPIVMLTARAGEDDKIEGLETGIDDYLIKPFSPRELLVRLDNLIAQRERLRRRFATATRISPNDVSAVNMDQEFVRRVLQCIEGHIGDDGFSVEALAAEIGMSQSQLNRKLRALVDQSAGKLIRSMRLQRAADLLIQQAGTVAEIGYRVGFGSHATFSTAFKKQFGVSPSEYKRSDR